MSQKERMALYVLGGGLLVGLVGFATGLDVVATIGFVGFAVGAVLGIMALRGRSR